MENGTYYKMNLTLKAAHEQNAYIERANIDTVNIAKKKKKVVSHQKKSHKKQRQALLTGY